MDSGNTKMKHKSSLFCSKGRFLLLFLFLASIQMMQATEGSEDTYLETEMSAKIVISEETTVSGLEHLQNASTKREKAYSELNQAGKMVISEGIIIVGLENLYMIDRETEKSKNLPKNLKKTLVVVKSESQETKKINAVKNQNIKHSYSFSNSYTSDTLLNIATSKLSALGSSTHNYKNIIISEVSILNLLLLIISIFIINLYESHLYFGHYFFHNFLRPPPTFFF